MKENLLYTQHRSNMLKYYEINSRNTRNDRESNQVNDKVRAGLSSNARWSLRPSFVKVIKTEKIHYISETKTDRTYICMTFCFIIFRRTINSRSGSHKSRNTLYIPNLAAEEFDFNDSPISSLSFVDLSTGSIVAGSLETQKETEPSAFFLHPLLEIVARVLPRGNLLPWLP